jgi:hypothetical protein
MNENPKKEDAVSRDEFHMWVGYCITAWSQVEDRLFQFCWNTLNCEPELAAIVYFRIPGLDGRISLANELVTAVLPSREKKNGGQDHPMVKAWSSIIKDTRAMLNVRRRLAHQPVQVLPYSYDVPLRCNDPIGPLNRTEYGVLHFTHPSDAERLRDENSAPLYLKDLQVHKARLEQINEAMGRYFLDPFLPRLLERRKPSPPSERG